MMKGQDIGLLLKLGCLRLTGISKSQVNLSLQRSIESGLAILDRKSQVPGANTGALKDFIVYGLPYVFSVKLEAVTRGISISLAAPILQSVLQSAEPRLP